MNDECKILVEENFILKQRIKSLESYLHDLKQDLKEQKLAIVEAANVQADRIIALSIDVAFEFKVVLDNLLKALKDYQEDATKCQELISQFLLKHHYNDTLKEIWQEKLTTNFNK